MSSDPSTPAPRTDDASLRARILARIREIADREGGRPPGKGRFEQITGITEHQWYGTIWPNWSSAVREAGFEPNIRPERIRDDAVTTYVAEQTRRLGRFPSMAELKLALRSKASGFSYAVIQKRFATKAALVEAVRQLAESDPVFADLHRLLPSQPKVVDVVSTGALSGCKAGWVYLIQHGTSSEFKIGRSDDIARRVGQIRTQMPQIPNLLHAIQTDDVVGIEAYWHKRFAEKRLNAEWFKLDAADIRSFRRRKFQ